MPVRSEPVKPVRLCALGVAIRQQREACHLTQKQLAKRAKLRESQVGLLESGRRYPCWDVLCALSAALEIRLSLLIHQAEDLQRGSPACGPA